MQNPEVWEVKNNLPEVMQLVSGSAEFESRQAGPRSSVLKPLYYVCINGKRVNLESGGTGLNPGSLL